MPDRAAIRDYVRQQTLIEQDDWADAKLDSVINQGLRMLSVKFDWPWLAASTTLSVVAGTSSYTMPTDLRKTLAITRQDKPQRLVEVSPYEVLGVVGGDLPSGTPAAYFVHGRDLYLDKVPTESATYDWLYYTSPTLLDDDTDEPEFVEEFHLVLADYAVAKAWEREEDFAKAAEARKDFDQGVEAMAVFYLDVARDRPVVWGVSRDMVYRGAANNLPWLDGV